jgi:hypothetical protein
MEDGAVTGIYLGEAVEIIGDYGNGWILCWWVNENPKKRRLWNQWSDQVERV